MESNSLVSSAWYRLVPWSDFYHVALRKEAEEEGDSQPPSKVKPSDSSKILIINLLKRKKSIMKAWRFAQEGRGVNITLDVLNAWGIYLDKLQKHIITHNHTNKHTNCKSLVQLQVASTSRYTNVNDGNVSQTGGQSTTLSQLLHELLHLHLN